jgi:hypothetical protein
MSAQSDWAQLFRIACAMIRQVNAEQQIIDRWTFGGGTAMMLQIDHRVSHDIVLPDPQILPFLDPQSMTSILRSSLPITGEMVRGS